MKINNTQNFTQLYSDVKQKQLDQGYKAGKHLRFDDQSKQKGLYFHTGVSRPRIFDWSGKHAARRIQKRQDAGQQVWQSLANQHGEQVANRIFKNVLGNVRGDHRQSVTIGDLDRIQRALPMESVKQQAIRLAAKGFVPPEEVMQHMADNLEVYASDEFAKTSVAKYRPEQFRFMQAMAFYDRISNHGYTDNDLSGFLKAIGVNAPGNEKTIPHEVLKQWMADQVFERFFPKNSSFELNFRGEDRTKFADQFRNSKGDANERISLLREKFLKISSLDGEPMIKGLAIGIAEMQGTHNATAAIDKAITAEGKTEGVLERQIRVSRNESLVRQSLPGTRRFNDILGTAGWYPQLLMHTEQQYIANRLRGLAELKAQQGDEVDQTWVESQIKRMLKELDGPEGVSSSQLPQLQREAEIAAGELLQALLDTRSFSLADLNAKILDFQAKSAKLTHTRRPEFGPEDVQEDQQLLLLRAGGRLRNRSHLDPLANVSSVLRAAYFAMADSRTDQRNFFDNERSSQIAPQMAEYIDIVKFAVDQVQFRKGQPNLRDEFEERRSEAERIVSSHKTAPEIPGIPRDTVRDTVNVIVERGLEAVERRERQESISEFIPPEDEN